MEQVVKITRETKTNADGLAACFGLTRPRIVQLANDGVLNRDKNSKYDLADNILRYVNSKSGSTQSYDTERTKHEKLKSRMTELRLARMEERMHDAKDVEMVMTEMLTNLRIQLQGIPSIMAPQLANKSQEAIYEILLKSIEEKIAELRDYSPDMFNTGAEFDAEDG